MVVKYADNLLKGFATSISIVFSCIFSIYFFSDFNVSMQVRRRTQHPPPPAGARLPTPTLDLSLPASLALTLPSLSACLSSSSWARCW